VVSVAFDNVLSKVCGRFGSRRKCRWSMLKRTERKFHLHVVSRSDLRKLVASCHFRYD
jgi:hypothetical protein